MNTLSFDLFNAIGWGISISIALYCVKSAIEKIIGTKQMIERFNKMELSPFRVVTGIIELINIILFMIPLTSLYGVIFICAFMNAKMVSQSYLNEERKDYLPIFIGMSAGIAFLLRM